MSDELSSIEPAILNSYLERRNWSRVGNRRGAILWMPQGSGKTYTSMRLIVPSSLMFSDDEELVAEAIHKLAKWENRDVEEVSDELSNPGADRQVFKTHPPATERAIPLDEGFKALQAIHELIKTAGRRVAEGDQLLYQGQRPRVVSRFIENVELLPTKPGSYIFTTRVNLLQETVLRSSGPLGESHSDELASISNHAVVKELRREISAIHKMALKRLEGIRAVDPTELRISVNACNALSSLGGPERDRPFEIEFLSGFSDANNFPDSEVSFTTSMIDETYRFGVELEELARTGSASIEGEVESLERRSGEHPRVKIVGDRRLKDSTRRGALWVIVAEGDYHRAYEAQKWGRRVRASGQLSWEKRRMELMLGSNEIEILRD